MVQAQGNVYLECIKNYGCMQIMHLVYASTTSLKIYLFTSFICGCSQGTIRGQKLNVDMRRLCVPIIKV